MIFRFLVMDVWHKHDSRRLNTASITRSSIVSHRAVVSGIDIIRVLPSSSLFSLITQLIPRDNRQSGHHHCQSGLGLRLYWGLVLMVQARVRKTCLNNQDYTTRDYTRGHTTRHTKNTTPGLQWKQEETLFDKMFLQAIYNSTKSAGVGDTLSRANPLDQDSNYHQALLHLTGWI